MRKLWSPGVASHKGELLRFDDAGCFPKPDQGARVPVIFGGESEPALRRVAEYGDGWYGFNLDPESAAAKIKILERFLADNGRGLGDVELIVAPYTKHIAPTTWRVTSDLGVSEVVLLATCPEPAEAVASIERFARMDRARGAVLTPERRTPSWPC